jgi:hypothetical protein
MEGGKWEMILGYEDIQSFPLGQPLFSEKSQRSLLLLDHKLFFTASSDARKLMGAEGLRSHPSQDGVLMRDR